jgi:predicted ATPase
MSRIVITGGPGAGKTTLLLALQARGYTIVGDSPRTIIQDRLRRGLSPRPSAYEFAHETLRMDIKNFVHHAATPGYVFFDRSVLDALCGLDRVAPLNESELSMWLSKYQYCSKVFVLPPWKAIYVNDDERDHTFEHAESVYSTVQEWYHRRLGCRLTQSHRLCTGKGPQGRKQQSRSRATGPGSMKSLSFETENALRVGPGERF